MRTVEDEDGRRHLLLKESGESSLVRDLETGEHRHLANDSLAAVEGDSPLVAAARSLPDSQRDALDAFPDERALGLVVLLDARGPVPVRDLLAETDVCESDLHGMVGELRAGGFVRETTVAGERGYEITPAGSQALDAVDS